MDHEFPAAGDRPPAQTPPQGAAITKSERYRQILSVLARHGIGAAEDHFIRHEAGERAAAEHLRRACEELGTMFVKLGQVLSTRADLLPDAYRAELAKLQDEVAPLPAEAIVDVVRQDLGQPPERLFAFFDPKPLGSASIGQVHAARLFDGRDVVLKVRKPQVDELVRIDLQILAGLIDEWTPRFPVLEEYDARALVREFADALRAELDYGREAANVKFFRELFNSDHGFKIPEVIEDRSKNRVLTEERVKGCKATDLAHLPKRLRAVVARRIASLVLEPAFGRGVFYADPHPGNLLVEEDGTLSVIDFGKVGRLTPDQRRHLADMFIAIGRCDAQRLTDSLIEITAPDHPVERDLIAAEIDRMLKLYVDVSLEHVRFGDAVGELLQLIRRQGLRLPGTIVQFFKALAMCEGILQTLDPDASFADYLQPAMRKMIYQAFAGPQLLDRLTASAIDAAELAIELPRRIDRVLGEVERGNLRVWTRIEDADPLMKRLERMVKRSNATMLAAACIIGLAVLMQFYRPQGWQGWIGAVFWIAVAAAGAGAVSTLWTLRK